MFDSVFGKSFNSGKCKTLLKLATSRIKLLRNKRDIQLKQMKKEFVQLLQTNQEPSARIRVEHIYREQNIMAAYEIIELFCELVVVRLPIIDSQRQCPIDLKEAVASLIFVAPRCADLPELQQIRNLFAAKYGKEFVAAAAELRPDCGVNRLIIEKLSVRAPTGEVKLKLMKDIAEEQGVDWDPTKSESELLKAPEDLLEGPSRFLGASEMPLRVPTTLEEPNFQDPITEGNQANLTVESRAEPFEIPNNVSMDDKQFIPFVRAQSASSNVNAQPQKVFHEQVSRVPSSTSAQKDATIRSNDRMESTSVNATVQPQKFSHNQSSRVPSVREVAMHGSDDRDDEEPRMNQRESFEDVAAAAHAAAEAAERAAAAARAAASLAKLGSSKSFEKNVTLSSGSDSDDQGDLRTGSNMQPGHTEKYFKVRMDSFNGHIAQEKPHFDEYGEQDSSHRGQRQSSISKKQNLWKESSSDEESDFKAEQTSFRNFRPKYDDEVDSSVNHSINWNSQDDDRKSPSMNSINPDYAGSYERQASKSGGEPPQRPPPNVPGGANQVFHVHPKLPDYDDLAVRFEALRSARR